MQTGSVPTFGVTGELHDGAAGLVHLRARWYTSRHGTLTSVDPFAGFAAQPYSQHPYQYAYSNPVRWTDPSGRDPWWAEPPRWPGQYHPTPYEAIEWRGRACAYAQRMRAPADIALYCDPEPLTSPVLNVIPVIGTAKGIAEAVVGCDIVTGEELGVWRWAGLVGLRELRLGAGAGRLWRGGRINWFAKEQGGGWIGGGGADELRAADGGGGGGGSGSQPKLLTDQNRTVGGQDPVSYARAARGGSNLRGAAGQRALETMYGPGGAPETFITRSGDVRMVDYVIRRSGRIYAYEGKNSRIRTVPGRPNREFEEIRKDVILMQERPGYTPVWVFFDKEPGQTLKTELDRVGILYIIHR